MHLEILKHLHQLNHFPYNLHLTLAMLWWITFKKVWKINAWSDRTLELENVGFKDLHYVLSRGNWLQAW